MLQIGSCCNNHLIINVIFKRLGVKAGKDSLPFAIFVFAKSKDEVENKLEKLRESQFPEFREELAPMIYWDDKYDDMEVTDDVTSSLHNFTILRNLSTLSFTPILKSLRRLWHYGTRF